MKTLSSAAAIILAIASRAATAADDESIAPTEADRLSASGLNLPSGCSLDDATVRHVAETVRRLLTK